MTIEELKEIIARDEGETIEFKESTGQRGDACETLCAFLNRDGGTVVFGVSDTLRQFVRGERASGRSVVWNTERPSRGEGEGDGRGASRRTSVSFGERTGSRAGRGPGSGFRDIIAAL